MRRTFLVLLFAAMVAVSAFAQRGNFMVSGGLAMGNTSGSLSGLSGSGSGNLIGVTLAVDYALPIYGNALPLHGLSIGGEVNYLVGNIEGFLDTGVLPIMARLGYHRNFGLRNLDIFGLAKIGLARMTLAGDSSVGFGFGLDIGGRYFFTETFAAFAELGFDNYFYNASGVKGSGRKIFTVGFAYKFFR